VSDAATQARTKAAATYNAAADFYEHPALSFWDRFGRRTVERLGLRPGEMALDVCCGAGASAIPAAEQVAPTGRVVAVDLAENLLKLAQAKCRECGISNVEFRAGDMLNLGYPAGMFDAAICVFGIFFVPDMESAVRELWRMVKPGGKLAITTWGPNLFESANSIFWEAIARERADLREGFHPWDRICDPAGVQAMLRGGGVETADIVAETGTHPFTSPNDWWPIVLGSGYRGTIDQLPPDARERVRQAMLHQLRDRQITAVQTNVVYARAVKSVASR